MGSRQSKIIAAIDFGTKYTGFAYAFEDDQEHIITASHGTLLPEDRVPTVLLLNSDETFNSFGIHAEDVYSELVLNDMHRSYRLFRDFKMALYTNNEKLKGDHKLYDTEGRPIMAVAVFSIIIRHLKSLVIRSIGESRYGSFGGNIYWILTIPAIWSNAAGQFMRNAAKAGGIDTERLRLVLEPEAAALFCKSQNLYASGKTFLTPHELQSKYIVADLGGGTADICAHETLKKGNIRELYRVVGGPFGGTTVNTSFVQFLIKLFGAPVWREFQHNQCYDFTNMMRAFESKKQRFGVDHSTKFVIDIPTSLIGIVMRDVQSDLITLVSSSEFENSVQVRDNKLICEKEVMEGFFKTSLQGIISELQIVLSACKDVKMLLLVGGFAESQYVRKSIRRKLNGVQILLPQEPRFAVLKGAVKMGFQPKTIIERKARFTYGICVAEPFKNGKHPECFKFKRGDRLFCDRLFSKVIEKDTILKCHQEFEVKTCIECNDLESKSVSFRVSLYRSNKMNPMFCTVADDCEEVGQIIVKAPREGWPANCEIGVFLKVDDTDLIVNAYDKNNSRQYEAYADFL